MCTAAFDEEYEKVSSSGGVSPLTEPMLITRAGCAGWGRGAKHRQQPLGKKEHSSDIHVHDLVPPLRAELVERLAPGCTGVVDQDVQRIPAFIDGGLTR